MLSTLISISSQFALLALLARLVPPHEMGLVALVGLVNAFLDVFIGLGLPASLIHARFLTSRETSSVYWAVVLSNIVLATVLVSVSPALALFYGDQTLSLLLCVAAGAIVINGFGQVPKALLERRLRFIRTSAADICYSLFLVTTALFLALHGWGAYAYVWALVVASGARTGIWLVGARTSFIPRFYFRVGLTKRFLQFGVFQAADGIVNFATNYISSMVLGRLVGPSALGGYTLAYNTAVNTPAKLNPVITRVMFPVLASLQKDKSRIAVNYMRVNSLCLLALGPALIGLALIAEPFMGLVYGDHYRQYAEVLTVLALSGLLRTYGNPLGSMLAATGAVRLGFSLNLFRALIAIPLTALLVMLMGAEGAALGVVFSNLLGYGVGTICSYRVLGITAWSYLSGFMRALLPSIPMAAIVLALQALLTENVGELSLMAIQIFFGAATYMLVCFWSRHPTLVYVRRNLIRQGT